MRLSFGRLQISKKWRKEGGGLGYTFDQSQKGGLDIDVVFGGDLKE